MIKKCLTSALALGAAASFALAAPVRAADPQSGPVELRDAQLDRVTAGEARDAPINPNWGALTSDAAGFELGEHASNPPPTDLDRPGRAGLANIVEPGNLAATIDAVAP